MKLLLLAGAIVAWLVLFLFRFRNEGRWGRRLVPAVAGSIVLGLLTYYIGAVLWTFRYGA